MTQSACLLGVFHHLDDDITEYNQISDVSPLASLTNLTDLYLLFRIHRGRSRIIV